MYFAKAGSASKAFNIFLQHFQIRMAVRSVLVVVLVAALLVVAYFFFATPESNQDDFVTYRLPVQNDTLKMYWKDDKGKLFRSIGNLKSWLEQDNITLVFAMNGGMFRPGNAPQGLFIQEGQIITPVDTTTASGNFYIKPNGIFYISTNSKAAICKTEAFQNDSNISYATQSGPMLVIDGSIHPAFRQGSANRHVRNGVGILPDSTVVFAMSKDPVNFYDFAKYFKELGCTNALYLDGFVSRTYLPEQNWVQLDGDFGVIIGVVAKQH
jgi:uncharacterized protein YigE (DUF2233 family)